MGRARSVAATAGVLVVAVALVVLAGFAGAGYYNLSTAEAAQLSRAQLRQLAFDAVPKVFGFDYQTVEASMTEAEGLLTPAYRIEFAERAKTERQCDRHQTFAFERRLIRLGGGLSGQLIGHRT